MGNEQIGHGHTGHAMPSMPVYGGTGAGAAEPDIGPKVLNRGHVSEPAI